LRTLLRQLLAGTGWIMDSSISKDKATRLIKRLLGQDLAEIVRVELPSGSFGGRPPESKDIHYSGILAEIMSYVLERSVTEYETKKYITRDKGPYRLAAVFVDELNDRCWPPCLPNADELRSYGCYREGESAGNLKMVEYC